MRPKEVSPFCVVPRLGGMESSRIGSVNEGGELGLDCGGERRRVGVGLNSGTRSSEGAEVSRRLLGRGTDRHCRGSGDVVG